MTITTILEISIVSALIAAVIGVLALARKHKIHITYDANGLEASLKNEASTTNIQ